MLRILKLIFSRNTFTVTPRNHILLAFWASLSPVKSTIKCTITDISSGSRIQDLWVFLLFFSFLLFQFSILRTFYCFSQEVRHHWSCLPLFVCLMSLFSLPTFNVSFPLVFSNVTMICLDMIFFFLPCLRASKILWFGRYCVPHFKTCFVIIYSNICSASFHLSSHFGM